MNIGEQQRKEFIYLMALSVLRKIYNDGLICKEVFVRLNRKNAETMGCAEMPVD